MAKTVADILAMIQENDIKMVDFKMVDINGQYRHVTISRKKLFRGNHAKRHWL